MSKNNGGPAFPAMHFDLAENERGMTLRDYFAAKAMQALIADIVNMPVNSKKSAEELLAAAGPVAYMAADYMLKAREA